MGQIPTDLAACLLSTAKFGVALVQASYRCKLKEYRINPRRMEMRKNYPDVRLNINGEFVH